MFSPKIPALLTFVLAASSVQRFPASGFPVIDSIPTPELVEALEDGKLSLGVIKYVPLLGDSDTIPLLDKRSGIQDEVNVGSE